VVVLVIFPLGNMEAFKETSPSKSILEDKSRQESGMQIEMMGTGGVGAILAAAESFEDNRD
jgi:hypothetical protein